MSGQRVQNRTLRLILGVTVIPIWQVHDWENRRAAFQPTPTTISPPPATFHNGQSDRWNASVYHPAPRQPPADEGDPLMQAGPSANQMEKAR